MRIACDKNIINKVSLDLHNTQNNPNITSDFIVESM